MSNIVLSAAVRNNVLTLQRIAGQQDVVQNRLSTGLKVSSALDDPRNFFQAQALNFRANDLARLQDNMGLAIKTIQAADKGITAMTKIAENMAALAKQARDTTDTTARASLAAQYEELREQMARIASDSGFNGINLLAGEELEVTFNEDASSTLVINPAGAGQVNYAAAIDANGDFVPGTAVAGIAAPTGDWAATTAIDASIAEINAAIADFRTQAAVFGSNLTMVRIREDFTKEMINTLKAGADGLTLADQNEEAANLLALNTRQQLSQQALALATQSEQSILRLLG